MTRSSADSDRQKRLQIAVIGAGVADEKERAVAEEVGIELGKAGHILICGGLGGVMEAVSKGVKSEDGLTVGILPGDKKEDANQYIDISVVTDMGHARNAIITRTADALIAVGGEAGTLSEIALAIKMGKPVVLIRGALPRYEMADNGIHIAADPSEAVNRSIGLAMKLREGVS